MALRRRRIQPPTEVCLLKPTIASFVIGFRMTVLVVRATKRARDARDSVGVTGIPRPAAASVGSVGSRASGYPPGPGRLGSGLRAVEDGAFEGPRRQPGLPAGRRVFVDDQVGLIIGGGPAVRAAYAYSRLDKSTVDNDAGCAGSTPTPTTTPEDETTTENIDDDPTTGARRTRPSGPS